MTSYLDILKCEKFEKYYEFLVSENEKYNLTAITEKEEVYVRHFFDSLHLEELVDFDRALEICDVGSGAGFPSIPIKIMHPNLKVTIIEPTLKRCKFLESLVSLLELDNVSIINKRAEDVRDLKFDIVCARAVSNMQILLELVKIHSKFYAMKGSSVDVEIKNAKCALNTLNSKITKEYEYTLEKEGSILGTYKIIEVLKEKDISNKYPRPYSQIKKKPL